MNEQNRPKRMQDLINKDKWWDILSRFIDVLRINVFIVDHEGNMVLPPEERRYGGRLLYDQSLGFDLLQDSRVNISHFEKQGTYGEGVNRYGLHSYAIPIIIGHQEALAHVIVGPIVMNKRLRFTEYQSQAEEVGANIEILMDEINEIRVVSNLMMNSILDLLAEIFRDNIDLIIKNQELDQLKADHERSEEKELSEHIDEGAREIYSEVRTDELLVTLLDLALKMTNTECGSIMVVDPETGEMTIKVSRGIDQNKVEKTRVKVGEGISGIAASENSAFHIKGKEGDNRIKHLLKRGDIKESLVMPLKTQKEVFGVLNIHTKNSASKIEDSLDNIQHLTKLVSTAI